MQDERRRKVRLFWVDHSTIGTLVHFRRHRPGQAAIIAVNFRNATEH